MPQSKQLFTTIRSSPPVSWIGAIAAGFVLWSFLVWRICEVTIGLL